MRHGLELYFSMHFFEKTPYMNYRFVRRNSRTLPMYHRPHIDERRLDNPFDENWPFDLFRKISSSSYSYHFILAHARILSFWIVRESSIRRVDVGFIYSLFKNDASIFFFSVRRKKGEKKNVFFPFFIRLLE